MELGDNTVVSTKSTGIEFELEDSEYVVHCCNCGVGMWCSETVYSEFIIWDMNNNTHFICPSCQPYKYLYLW